MSTARRITLVGLLGLASAMGIGRFAFTPLLPLMQQHSGLGLADGAHLASANYLGYLLGALACTLAPPAPARGARWGLVAVAVLTLGMGATAHMGAWLALRLAAGAASAFVLVGMSGWALPQLASRPAAPGVVYGGVGLGVAGAGLVGLVAALGAWPPAQAWWVLGLLSGAVALLAWQPLRQTAVAPHAATGAANAAAAAATAGPARTLRQDLRLVLCYATFGYGYIIPATFLPATARTLVADPAVFGAVWPVFGFAAAASTVAATTVLRGLSPRRLWMGGQCVMTFGVLAPLLSPGLAGLLVAALCVGGTFMVITMAGIQEARRIAGASAPRLIAAMTTGFALAQCAGPLSVGAVAALGLGVHAPSLLAAALLLLGAWGLRERG